MRKILFALIGLVAGSVCLKAQEGQDVLDTLAAGRIDKDITSAIEETAAVVVASMKQ